MPNKLQNMEITSIDLVEAGANQEAEITIVKGKDDQMQDFDALVEQALMENGEVAKAIDESTIKELADGIVSLIRRKLGGNSDSDQGNSKEDTKKSLEAEEVLTDVEVEEPEEVSVEEPDLEKGMDNEIFKSLQKKVEELQKSNSEITKANAELRKKIEINELVKVAGKYSEIGYNVADLAKTLYAIKQKDTGIYEDFIAVLDNSLNFQKSSDIFREIGSSMANNGLTDTDKVINSYVEKGSTRAEAYEKALLEHPELLIEE